MTDKRMLVDYPLLVAEWDYEKNSELDIQEVRHGSHKKVWWKCSKCGYSWAAEVKSRSRLGRGCPSCAGVRVNSLDVDYPKLVKFWDYDKNEKLPNEYTAGMYKKVWWKCEREHSWEIEIFRMVHRNSNEEYGYCLDCRFIDGDRFMSEEKYPQLYKEFDKFKNNGKKFSEYKKGRLEKVWWICPNQHSYQSDFPNRLRGRKCPICAGKKTMRLDEEFPDFIDEWADERNISDFTSGSSYVARWSCESNHEYYESIQKHAKKRNCAICSDRVFKPFYSEDFDLLAEWDYKKNAMSPEKFSAGSHKKVWWKCSKCGYSWQNHIYAYVRGTRCKKCSAREKSSEGEKELANFIESVCSDFNYRIVRNDFSLISPYELDVYIPDLCIAFEFNGDYWHSDEVIRRRSGMSAEEYHNRKVNLCLMKNVELLYVWEKDWVSDKILVKKKINERIQEKTKLKDVGGRENNDR